jgi:type II secretory pathway pseudopilin PulG
MRSGNRRTAEGGFTYIALLIFVAVITAGVAATLEGGSRLQEHSREAELLAIGLEYRAALLRYAQATPPGFPDAPRELAELLRDSRFPNKVRHLRRIYADPLTGKDEWGIDRLPDGRIRGLHSLSTTPTLKRVQFPRGLEAFEQAERHDQWLFSAETTALRPSAVRPGG